MKPKEQLANEILETRSGDITKTLKPYAIGRWVPVEERLPEFKGNPHQHWKGLVMPTNKRPLWITWYPDDDCEEITHWLDLDLPSGKGKA